MMYKNMIKIDSAKLEKELKKRNLTKMEVSKQLGYGETYIVNVTSRGMISEPAAKLLNNLYNIDIDSYKYVQEEPVPQAPAPAPAAIDYDKLNEILYDAVFRAVRDALKG